MTRQELTFKDAQAEAKKLAADEARPYDVYKLKSGFAYCPADAKTEWNPTCRVATYGSEK